MAGSGTFLPVAKVTNRHDTDGGSFRGSHTMCGMICAQCFRHKLLTQQKGLSCRERGRISIGQTYYSLSQFIAEIAEVLVLWAVVACQIKVQSGARFAE